MSEWIGSDSSTKINKQNLPSVVNDVDHSSAFAQGAHVKILRLRRLIIWRKTEKLNNEKQLSTQIYPKILVCRNYIITLTTSMF